MSSDVEVNDRDTLIDLDRGVIEVGMATVTFDRAQHTWMVKPHGHSTAYVRQSLRPQLLALGWRDPEPGELTEDGTLTNGHAPPEDPIYTKLREKYGDAMPSEEDTPDLAKRVERLETGMGEIKDGLAKVLQHLGAE